jgi:hypothetical protein
MAWSALELAPGLNVELTPTDNRGRYTDTNLGRFKAGRFQKMGGWGKYFSAAVEGYPRAMHAWQDLAANDRLAVGTTTQLVDVTSSTETNITPQTITTTPAPDFSTVIGTPVVTVVDAGITNVTAYDAVYFDTPISIDGIILHGLYQITAYLSAHSYSITAATNAVAGVANGGVVPTFDTTSGAANVDVGIPAHGLIAGDDVVFALPTTAGGIVISGRYIVQSVTSVDVFVITAKNSATATTTPAVEMNGGDASLTYHIAIGPIAAGGAYGVGDYGAGLYGLGSAISAQVGTDITATDYTLANWGELLLACPENGKIHYWGPASGFGNAAIIAEAPVYNTGMFVSNAQQMIIAYGSTVKAAIGEYQDPLMVKWCDSENFFDWTASSTNQAGSWRIANGSRCVGGATMPNRQVIWTDQAVWAFDYIGSSLVFGVTEKAAGCGLIAKHAHAKLGETLFWMSGSGFWSMSGEAVNHLDCPVWDAVFQDLDTANAARCFAGANSDFTEVMFFYPSQSGGLGYCDKYAKFNAVSGEWDIGAMQRNAWLDRSVVGNPVAATNGGMIYKHEYGYDADAAPLISSFTTAWFYVGEGEDCVFLDRIYPDFKWGEHDGSAENAVLQITVYAVQYPGDTPKVFGPFSVNKAKRFISKRMRARQIMLKVENIDMGSFWRLGRVRMRWAFDGRGR